MPAPAKCARGNPNPRRASRHFASNGTPRSSAAGTVYLVFTGCRDDDADPLVPSGDYTAELSYRGTKVKQTFPVSLEEGIAAHGTYRGQ